MKRPLVFSKLIPVLALAAAVMVGLEPGANAVVNVRYSTSSIAQGAAELYAYGTAVRVE
jgi:uncharacterized protein YbjQ (UPF0145 family)